MHEKGQQLVLPGKVSRTDRCPVARMDTSINRLSRVTLRARIPRVYIYSRTDTLVGK